MGRRDLTDCSPTLLNTRGNNDSRQGRENGAGRGQKGSRPHLEPNNPDTIVTGPTERRPPLAPKRRDGSKNTTDINNGIKLGRTRNGRAVIVRRSVMKIRNDPKNRQVVRTEKVGRYSREKCSVDATCTSLSVLPP